MRLARSAIWTSIVASRAISQVRCTQATACDPSGRSLDLDRVHCFEELVALRLVVLASVICVPLVPWIWQYSRVIWIYFDRYFDPDPVRMPVLGTGKIEKEGSP